MQVPNPEKRSRILAVAGELFATRRYDEVTLDAIAKIAKVGKGTVYVYFASKDELFLALVRESVDAMLVDLESKIGSAAASGEPGWNQLVSIVTAMLALAKRFPRLFELLRSGAVPALDDAQIEHHARFTRIVVKAIEHGVDEGDLDDPDPALTAQCILGYVRNTLLFPGRRRSEKAVRDHLLRLLERGIRVPRRRLAGRLL
jgi:AcrR family transcriptional regulator